MSRISPRYWAVLPAAGVGKRMGGPVPKQYLDLAGRPVIAHTLSRLLAHDKIQAVAVALGSQDGWWPDAGFADHARIIRAPGGAERCHSVLNGLQALQGRAAADDWVLVHDAARPCIRQADLDKLIRQASGHAVGGLLGVPVRDTMKRCAESGEIQKTVDRDCLWHAFTPQMFRYEELRQALQTALDTDQLVTDEASAMELAGKMPLMVEGHDDNIKVTRPADLPLAAFYLQRQEEEQC